MKLKTQYLFFLIFMAVVFALFIFGLLEFLNHKQYLLAGLLTIIIYGTFFLIGKKLSILFLQLTLLKELRKTGGTASYSECEQIIKTRYRKKVTEDEFSKLMKNILTLLKAKQLISIDGNSIVVLDKRNIPDNSNHNT